MFTATVWAAILTVCPFSFTKSDRHANNDALAAAALFARHQAAPRFSCSFSGHRSSSQKPICGLINSIPNSQPSARSRPAPNDHGRIRLFAHHIRQLDCLFDFQIHREDHHAPIRPHHARLRFFPKQFPARIPLHSYGNTRIDPHAPALFTAGQWRGFASATGWMDLPGILGARLARKSVIPGPLSGSREMPHRSFEEGIPTSKNGRGRVRWVNGTQGQVEI